MTSRFPVWLGAVLSLSLALPTQAAVPGTLLVEGTLANIAGAPVTDGVYSIKFAIYGDAVNTSPLWVEGPVAVAVKGGGFSQLLGATVPLTNSMLAAGTSPMLALKLGADPELPRKPLASVPFALRAAMAEGLECTGCVSATALAPSVFDAITAASNLATVAHTGEYASLLNKPTLVTVGQSCAIGQAMSGIDATGKIACAAGSSIGNDPLGYVSNGALANIFPTTTAGNSNISIPDNSPTGVSDTINVASGYPISTISVSVNISNSDITHLTVNLIAPDKSVIVLFSKNGYVGGNIVTSYPDVTPVYSGDLAGWSGKSAKGAWQIQLIDSAMQPGGAQYDGKLNSWSIALGYPSGNKVEAKGDFTIDGNLVVNGTNNIFPTGAIVAFTSATCPVGWVPANGNNGTPNLAGRMPIGVGALPFGGASVTYGASGGSNKWRISTSSATSPNVSCSNNCNTFKYLTGVTMDMESPNTATADTNNGNGGGAYLDMMPPYAGVYYCVKQ